MALMFLPMANTQIHTPIRPPVGGVVLVAAVGWPRDCLRLLVLDYEDCAGFARVDFAPVVALGEMNAVVRLYFQPTPYDPDTDPVDEANFVTEYEIIVYGDSCLS